MIFTQIPPHAPIPPEFDKLKHFYNLYSIIMVMELIGGFYEIK